jgi:triacylglycerol lipase
MAERKKPLPRIDLRNAPPPYDEFEGEEAGRSDYFYFADADRGRAADRNPFRPDARGFELVNAWWLCEAATLVYSAPERVKHIFETRTPLRQVNSFATGGGTECFVASNNDFAIVAFRGSELTPRADDPRDYSEIIKDWVRNFDIHTDDFGGARIHRGFAEGVEQLWRQTQFDELIAELSPRKIWFTGHSLGAALATVAAARVIAEGGRLDGLYTFGSPRVGDEAFGRMLAEKGPTCYRFVNRQDVVTMVPLFSKPPDAVDFKHAGTLRYIDGEGRISEDPTHFDRLKELARGLLKLGAVGRLFNLIPNAVEDHVPTLYSTHIWNAYVGEQGGGV